MQMPLFCLWCFIAASVYFYSFLRQMPLCCLWCFIASSQGFRVFPCRPPAMDADGLLRRDGYALPRLALDS
jgi:hypothetical protein